MENLKISTCALYWKHVYTNMCWDGQAAESPGCISSLKTVHIQPLMLMMQNNFQTLILSQCHSISIRLLYLLVTSRSVHLNRQCLLKKTELGW
jgi:hypothetical protein